MVSCPFLRKHSTYLRGQRLPFRHMKVPGMSVCCSETIYDLKVRRGFFDEVLRATKVGFILAREGYALF